MSEHQPTRTPQSEVEEFVAPNTTISVSAYDSSGRLLDRDKIVIPGESP